MPIINVETADSQFASAYLSFSSDLLEANQITDYLVRVVQPRLSALEGVQRADMLGGRTFAMRIWLKPDRLAALNLNPAQVRDALAANNFLSAVGQTKGSLVQVNLTANTDLRSVEEFRNLVVRQSGDRLVRLRDIADHLGGGLCPDRPAGRSYRVVVSRIRLYPGRRGVHFRRRCPHALPVHVLQAARCRTRGARPGRPDQPRFRSSPSNLWPGA